MLDIRLTLNFNLISNIILSELLLLQSFLHILDPKGLRQTFKINIFSIKLL